jgi:hypothetical protein
MKEQISLAVLATCIAALAVNSMPMAEAKAPIKQCIASPSKTQGHWSWRLIDGRKCWYAGKMVIAKSSLQWPAAEPKQARAVELKATEARTAETKTTEAKDAQANGAQFRPVAYPIGVAKEKRSDPMDAQARMLDDDSFESRWRARVSTE